MLRNPPLQKGNQENFGLPDPPICNDLLKPDTTHLNGPDLSLFVITKQKRRWCQSSSFKMFQSQVIERNYLRCFG